MASGAGELSDAELLAILLRTGSAGRNVLDLAHTLLAEFGDVRALARATPSELSRVALGMGQAKAAALAAAFELGRRAAGGRSGGVTSGLDEWRLLWTVRLSGEEREFIVAGFFDDSETLLTDERLSYGGPDGAVLDMAYLLRRAVRLDCRFVAVLHNHPDGTLLPSREDQRLTTEILRRLDMLGVGFLGHYLVVDGQSRPVAGV